MAMRLASQYHPQIGVSDVAAFSPERQGICRWRTPAASCSERDLFSGKTSQGLMIYSMLFPVKLCRVLAPSEEYV